MVCFVSPLKETVCFSGTHPLSLTKSCHIWGMIGDPGAFGLVFDHVTDDYKVVAVFCDPNLHYFTKVKVFSLPTNSWRKI